MYETILVPTDGSLTAQRAVEHATERASEDGAELHAVYVINTRSPISGAAPPFPDWEETARRLRQEAREDLDKATEPVRRAGVELRTTILEREGVADGILAYADEHDVDLVVMGTHGRSGLERLLLGSVAERVVRKARRPVLLVPPKPLPSRSGD